MFDENNIRKTLKSLSSEELLDSVYFYNMNFEVAPIEEIVNAINYIYVEVMGISSILFEENTNSVRINIISNKSGVKNFYDSYQKKLAILKKISESPEINEIIENIKEQKNKR